MLSAGPGRQKALYYILAIVAFSYLFFFYNLGNYSLKEPDEGRYAEIPREMVETGDYVVPHLNYVRYFEKPPLFYWMTALSYKVFGVDEWSFRFPNALAALFCVVTTYFFVARWFGAETALLSSLILMSSFGFFAMARIVTIDMLFSVLLFVSLLCFYQYYREKKEPFLYLFFAGAALATLAKGPVAPVLLGITIILFLFSENKFLFIKELSSSKGLLIFTLIAAPWFVAISLKEQEFFRFFFIDQHLLRFLTTKHHRSGPVYYFLPVLLGGLFPWSFFLPRAVIRLWRVKELRLFFIWALVVFAFFSVSGSKLPPYILPIFPGLAIILGYLFKSRWRQSVQRNREIIACVVFFSCTALAGLVHGSGLLDRYSGNVLPEIETISGDVKGLSLAISGVSIVILSALTLSRMRTFGAVFYMLGGFSLSVAIALMLHVHVIDGLNTTKGLAQALSASKNSAPLLVNYGSFDETLPFYAGRRTYLAAHTGELEMGAKYPDARSFFLSEDEFVRLFQSDRDVLVVFKGKRLPQLERVGIQGLKLIRCQDKRCLVANH